jgi:WD40 repeat protein
MLSKHNRIYAVPLLILCLLAFVMGADDPAPHFGDGIIILQLQDLTEYTERPVPLWPEISPLGNYVIARTKEHRRPYGNPLSPSSSTIYLWDIQDTSFNDGETAFVFPTVSYELPESTARYFVISPDDQLIAIDLDSEIWILTLPNFELQSRIPTYRQSSNSLAPSLFQWSSDGRLLGRISLPDLIVWDVETEEIYRHTLDEYTHTRLTALESGWLIGNRGEDTNDLAFGFCDQYLEQCNNYEFANSEYPIVSQDGRTILTRSNQATNNPGYWEVGVWTYQEDDMYELVDILQSDVTRCKMREFSPSGRYLFSSECGQTIWEFDSLTPIHQFGSATYIIHPYWLLGEGYFVTADLHNSPYNTLEMYRLGQQEFIDEFDAASIEEFDLIEHVIEETMYEFDEPNDIDLGGSLQMDDNRRFAMISIRWLLFLVPIEYE